MAITVTHAFVSNIADDPKAAAAGEVLPSHWNATHVVTGGSGRTILSADFTYYVRTTGSDSNGGTNPTTDAWATINHAMAFIANNVDTGGNNIIVDIGAGTFAGWGFRTVNGGGNIMFRGAGRASTTIGPGPADGVFNFGENVSFFVSCSPNIYINAVTFGLNNAENMVSGTFPGLSINLADLFNFAIDIQFQMSTGNNAIIMTGFIAIASGSGNTAIIQGNGNTIANFFVLADGATLFDFANWQINSNLTVGAGGAFCSITNAGQYISQGNVFGTGVGVTVTGQRYVCASNSVAALANNNLPGSLGPSFFPGNSDGTSDPSSSYDEYLGVVKASGLPTTTQFPDPNTGGLYKDTSGGGVYMVYNDAGTIKKVALT